MKKIRVVDATLRDGGCVIDFNFGDHDIETILNGLNDSGVDCIEIGYIHGTKGSENGRTQFIDGQAASRILCKKKKNNRTYLAMIDYGTFDMENLDPCSDETVDGIRLAFHKKNFQEIPEIGRTIIKKGYKLFIQPMLTLWYDDRELLDLIELVNQKLPDISGFYVVDTFGEMRNNDVIRILNIVDHNLNRDIPIGFHSHNNLQLSYSNAISVLQFPTSRDLYLDSSIMGMGKGAGNLISELLLEHLNLYYGGQYCIPPLLNVIDTVLNRIRANDYWGYSAEYYLSAVHHCSPSYAKHFHQKHMLPINEIAELLGKIDVLKRNSFDRDYADKLYREHITKSIHDEAAIASLKKRFSGKDVLVLAPGHSIETEREKIQQYIAEHEVVVLSVGIVHQNIPTDYLFISNRKRFKNFCESTISSDTQIICTSNIQSSSEKIIFVNYADYTCDIPSIESNAGMMALNLMVKLGIHQIILAGFDGFGFEQHAKDSQPDPMTYSEWRDINRAISCHVSKLCQETKIFFLTQTNYIIG